jgi:hypothetical protein
MPKHTTIALAVLSAAVAGCAVPPSAPPTGPISFFVTSVGVGKGGDLGGLEGADRHCQALAQAAGAGNRTWRAYLSTQGSSFTDTNVVHARDRIGAGPWFSAKGVQIASSVDDLHSAKNNVTKDTALTERGAVVTGSGDKPNRHDILTGSRPDGTAFPPTNLFADMTCGNWKKSGKQGSAMTGHHDKRGPVAYGWAISWNSAHPTVGCDPDSIRSTGGDALFYCFAEK